MEVRANKVRDEDVLVIVNVATNHIFMRRSVKSDAYSMLDPETKEWKSISSGWEELVHDGQGVAERVSLFAGDSFTITL